MSIFGHTVVGRPDVPVPDVVPDIELNKTFASVAADLRFVPGGHYSLAECQPYASPVDESQPDPIRPRNSKGQFVPKERSS